MLTDLTIRSAEPVVTLWDKTLKGFGIRIGKERKTFIVLIASGRRQTIGHYPLMSLADARKEARRILAEKELGHIRPTRIAFDDAKQDFLTACAKKNRPRTVKDYTWLLQRLPFGRQSVGDITPREIIKRLKDLEEAPATMQHVFVAGRAFFRWCVRQHLIDRSPMDNLAVPSNGRPRDRVLSDYELQAVYTTARQGKGTFHRIVSLLILTGQRRGEIAKLRWDWINRAERTITIPAEASKNARRHVFPYGDEVQAVLDLTSHYEPYNGRHSLLFPASRQRSEHTTCFNSWSKAKATFDVELIHSIDRPQQREHELIQLPSAHPWTLHDLRRTYSSNMAAIGVPQIVVEKLLNHVSGGTQSPIAQTYNRYSYMAEMRDAVGKWERYLAELVTTVTAPS